MINSHLADAALVLPSQPLKNNTYSARKVRVRDPLCKDWSSRFQTPGYYHHPPALSSRPFMGLGKFVAGRIHKLRAGKSYVGAHPTRRLPDADNSFPGCGLVPETFAHPILSCPSRLDVRTGLLHCVTDIGHEAPHSSSLPLLKRLAAFISVTCTGFPPTMFPLSTPKSSPPFALSPSMVPPPVFRAFALPEVDGLFLGISFL